MRVDASPLTAIAPSAVVQRYFYSQPLSTRASTRGGGVLYQLGEGLLGGLAHVAGLPVKVVGGGAKRVARTMRGISRSFKS